MARAEAVAAHERIVPAGSLPDPHVRYELSNVPTGALDLDATPLSGQQLGIAQALPFPGLLGTRRKAARAAAEASQDDLLQRGWRVRADVEQAWAELGFAQRALDVTLENLALLAQLTQAAEARYRVGAGLQQDVIRAQLAQTELVDERLRRVAGIEAAEARLAALLDAPPGAVFPRTTSLREATTLPDLAALVAALDAASPRLQALAARIEEARERQQAARLESYPDFDLGIGYRIRQRVTGDPVDGQDFLSAGLTVRLPVDRRKWGAVVAERGAVLQARRSERRQLRAELRDVLRSRHAQLVRADEEIVLIESGLLAQARLSLAASRSAYEVDAVDFLSVIDSQVQLLDAQLHLERALADRRIAFAALEAAMGAPLR